MRRIERYKILLEEISEETNNKKMLELTYQELINQLITYQDKKELTSHFEKLKKGFKQVVC